MTEDQRMKALRWSVLATALAAVLLLIGAGMLSEKHAPVPSVPAIEEPQPARVMQPPELDPC